MTSNKFRDQGRQSISNHGAHQEGKPLPQIELEDSAPITGVEPFGFIYLVRFAHGVIPQICGSLTLLIAGAGVVMYSARVLGRLVESLMNHKYQLTTPLSASFIGLETLAVVLQYFGRINLAHATIEMTYQIRCKLFEKIERLPLSYFDTQPIGRTITRITADVEGIEAFFSTTLARMLVAIINVMAVLVAMVLTDLNFGLLILGCSLPALAFSMAFRKSVKYWLRLHKRRSAHVNAKLAEYISGLGVIRIFGLEDWSQRSFVTYANDMREAGLNVMNWNSGLRPIAVLLCSIPTMLILWLGGDRVLAGTLEIGALVAFVRFSERFTAPIRTLSQEVQNIQEAMVSGERVRRMLVEPEEDAYLGPDGLLTPEIKGDIEYKNVSMSYVNHTSQILQNISFRVKSGMCVGLVGSTGSGKTTTMNLLPRLYPFQSGEILLDGTTITAINRDHLRKQLGYVYQDTVVTTGTFRSNLLETNANAGLSDQDLLEAARKTGLLHTLNRYPLGLDHAITDGGGNLSMGERQLLVLTGVLIRNPKILILDEATAHIDEPSQDLIQKAIAEVMQNRTSFIIAHRLSTVQLCDLILVFKGGQIVEQGDFQTLMDLKGIFANLVQKQLLSASI